MRTPFAVAHRAPSDPARARELARAGARMFELDIQLRGPDVVVSHYLPLPGVLAPIPVQRDNWRFRPGRGRDRSLLDAVAVLPSDVDVLLDPKHHAGFDAQALARAVAALLPALGGPNRFVVSTHAPALLAAYRGAGLRTWRSVGDPAQLRAVLADAPHTDSGVSVRHGLLDAESVAALHGVAGIISAWTVNRVARARHLVGLGVEAVTTDSAEVLTVIGRPERTP